MPAGWTVAGISFADLANLVVKQTDPLDPDQPSIGQRRYAVQSSSNRSHLTPSVIAWVTHRPGRGHCHAGPISHSTNAAGRGYHDGRQAAASMHVARRGPGGVQLRLMLPIDTFRTSSDVRSSVAIGGNADIPFRWRQDRF